MRRLAASLVVLASIGGAPEACKSATCTAEAEPECLAFCGSDVAGQAVCADGVWTCADGFVRHDRCANQCIGPGETCVECRVGGGQEPARCTSYEWQGYQIWGFECAAGMVLESECPCGGDYYVKDRIGRCGRLGDGNVACVPRPQALCTSPGPPACSCDGVVYVSACHAQREGHDLDPDGKCETPPGTFRCGEVFCTQGTEYCVVTTSPFAFERQGFSCAARPPCDGGAGCVCLSAEPCGDKCAESPPGELTLTCPGP